MYTRWLKTFQCYGSADGSTIMPVLPYLLAQNSGSWRISWVTAELHLLVEAPDPHGMIPTSTPNIHQVFENTQMLWMGRWIHHHATITICVGPWNEESWPYTWVTVGLQMMSRCSGWGPRPTWNSSQISSRHIKEVETFRCCDLLVEAPDPHGMIPTSTPNIYKVAENIHILKMGRWIHHRSKTTLFVGQNVGFSPYSWVTAGVQMKSRCIDWGPRPTCNGSHIHSKYTSGIWEH